MAHLLDSHRFDDRSVSFNIDLDHLDFCDFLSQKKRPPLFLEELHFCLSNSSLPVLAISVSRPHKKPQIRRYRCDLVCRLCSQSTLARWLGQGAEAEAPLLYFAVSGVFFCSPLFCSAQLRSIFCFDLLCSFQLQALLFSALLSSVYLLLTVLITQLNPASSSALASAFRPS